FLKKRKKEKKKKKKDRALSSDLGTLQTDLQTEMQLSKYQ
ncbi:hypothetical protein VN97_g6230, partial [Penicillium thymicola]